MYSKTRYWLLGCSIASFSLSALSGCTLDKKDEAGEFREAVPETQAVALPGPDASSSISAAAEGPSQRTLSTGAGTPYAKWYGFTREVRDGVNTVTAAVLGSVWLVVQSTPTAVSADSATWGPWDDDRLSPARYRVRVTRVAPDEYEYVFEGHSKTSAVDTDYRAVLTGHGYGKSHAKHGQGTFTIDLDVAKALDPYKHPNDSGKVAVTHDLPHYFSETIAALPRTITAEVTPLGEAHYTVESRALVDHSGTIHVDAHVDIDDSKTTKLEDVLVDSRWATSGAGRADITIVGGDLPANIPMVGATECWGTDFKQTYYEDSEGFEPVTGELSACVSGAR
jgi:hypothetical protein